MYIYSLQRRIILDGWRGMARFFDRELIIVPIQKYQYTREKKIQMK